MEVDIAYVDLDYRHAVGWHCHRDINLFRSET